MDRKRTGQIDRGGSDRNENTTVQTSAQLQATHDHLCGEPNDTDHLVWSLRKAGVPGTQIAIAMGVTKHAIYRRLKKFDEYHELREDENKQRDETTEEIVGLLEEGVSTNDIIDILGWNRSKFHSWLHRKAISVSRPPPKFDVEEAWKLFKSGESTGKLAIRYKVDRIAITRAFRRGHAQEYVDIVSRSRKRWSKARHESRQFMERGGWLGVVSNRGYANSYRKTLRNESRNHHGCIQGSLRRRISKDRSRTIDDSPS